MMLTSGENLTGEVGGVATEVTLGLSFLANIEITIQSAKENTTYSYLMMFLCLFCLASLRLVSSWWEAWRGRGSSSPTSHAQGSARHASR